MSFEADSLTVGVKKRMQGAMPRLVADGWTNIKNDAVGNYMSVSPVCSLYLETVQTGQQSHDNKLIAKDVQRIF